MTNFDNATIIDFGKVIFRPKNHTIPALPDMNLIIFLKDDVYQAICIEIEIDAIGDNIKDACNNLKQALHTYTLQMINNYNGNLNDVVKDIINTAFSQGKLKSQLFEKYLHAKRQHLLEKITKEHKAKSRKEEFLNAWHRIFQFEPIRINLTMAASIA